MLQNIHICMDIYRYIMRHSMYILAYFILTFCLQESPRRFNLHCSTAAGVHFFVG